MPHSGGPGFGGDRTPSKLAGDLARRVGQVRAALMAHWPRWLPGVTPSPSPEDAADPVEGHESGGRRRAHWVYSLFVQIVAFNLIGLAVFAAMLLGSSQFRKNTIDERLQALETYSRFVSGALEQSALVSRPGRPRNAPYSVIDRDRAIDILRELVEPSGLRGYIYDYDGNLIYDSWLLARDGQIDAQALNNEPAGFDPGRIAQNLMLRLLGPRLTPESGDPDMPFTEVTAAMEGSAVPGDRQALRQDENGNLIVSVAIPVKKLQRHVGVLRLSTKSGDFDALLLAERTAIVQIFLVALVANVLLAFLFTRTVVRPIRRLVAAADEIRFARPGPGGAGRGEIPGFGDRKDEIGELAHSLNEMTRTLNKRLDAIEQFAADVSHEIKTPLTSMRSAAETFDLAKTEASKGRLIEVIKHDVDRLDRLITDISNASRLDAELSRENAERVNIPRLLREIIRIYHDAGSLNGVGLTLDVRAGSRDETDLNVLGIETRLGQVMQNLIENAISFSPNGGSVRITVGLERQKTSPFISVRVEDDGPGIPEEALQKIFQRFYTQRPAEEEFGNNSGLGLSISEQIVEIHHGRIWAENRSRPDGSIAGAKFTVLLPADMTPAR